MQVRIKATEPQAVFLNMSCKFPAFIAGFGTGKSEVMCNSALLDSIEGGSDSLIAMYEPTYDLVRLILAPRMEEKLIDWGVGYKYNKSENIIYTSSGQMGDFVLRTLDNPSRIVGYESFRAKIDELDTLKKEHAQEAWTKIIARNRQCPSTYKKTSDKPRNTVSAFTTPEGFRFVYERWKRDPKPGYEMIQAATTSNPFLPDDYVDSLRDSYPEQLIEAYINGEFVNLTGGTVYRLFDRRLNHSDEVENGSETLHIGMDFNVGKMSAIVHVERGGKPIAVNEISSLLDTDEMIAEISRLYPNRAICVYPDSSGKNRKSVNASETDITKLEDAGFSLFYESTNPYVRDRINAMNAMFCNGSGERRYKVNTNKCPRYTDDLEQQVYDKRGEPDKAHDNDHTCFTGDTLVMTPAGSKRIDSLPVDGLVIAPNGKPVKYTNCGIKKKNEAIVTLVFDDESMVSCTPEHQILTESGKWVQAKEMTGLRCTSLEITSKYLTENRFINAAIITADQQEKVKSVFTESYGLSITEKSRAAITFTTKTMIEAITALKTCSYLTLLSTRRGIKRKSRAKGCGRLGRNINIEQKNGTLALKVENGTESTIKTAKSLCMEYSKLNVTNVEPGLIRRFLQKVTNVTSARTNARLHTEGKAELMTLRPLVSRAMMSSEQTNIPQGRTVVSVLQKDERSDVYCLAVPLWGCFSLANKLIVSNCDAGGYYITYAYPIIKPVSSAGFRWNR